MRIVSGGRTVQDVWNHHGGYKWTYFDESIKQYIEYFLSKRVHGKNLEIGGGWYLSVPGSVVLDISPVCLQGNPSDKKVIFDLESIAQGFSLPFADNTFDSVTAISVMQYVKNWVPLIKELERVCRPGAEFYLISGRGSGLEGCMVNTSRHEETEKQIREMGYDCIVENIPSNNGGVGDFKSICVAFPENGLFGPISEVRGKNYRLEQDKEICKDPKIFLREFARKEMNLQLSLLRSLNSYPVTSFSLDYRKRCEELSEEFKRRTGSDILLYLSHGIQPQLDMFLEGNFTFGAVELFDETFGGDDIFVKLCKEYDLSFVRHCNGRKSRKDLFKLFESVSSKESLAHFCTNIPLNNFTQDIINELITRFEKEDNELLVKAFGVRLFSVTSQYIQTRKINELLAQKARILNEGLEVDTKTLEFDRCVKHFPVLICPPLNPNWREVIDSPFLNY